MLLFSHQSSLTEVALRLRDVIEAQLGTIWLLIGRILLPCHIYAMYENNAWRNDGVNSGNITADTHKALLRLWVRHLKTFQDLLCRLMESGG
jgi:hypothetical protein